MVGWHHRLDGHEFKQSPGVGDGQGRLVGKTFKKKKRKESFTYVHASRITSHGEVPAFALGVMSPDCQSTFSHNHGSGEGDDRG